ncbi:hypothetical protein EPO04_01135 [Patescibacteria group bacterium]|nr:MAG: hypothetical protein EPO04_01135 [Patescibacteria group bacterium]
MAGWRFLIIIASCLLLSSTGYAASPAELKNKGLYISPLREQVTVQPGAAQRKILTVANYTDKPATIELSVESFSVANYSYEYRFLAPPQENWVRLDQTTILLQPNQSRQLSYSVQPAADAAPGGHYFTIFATKQAGEPTGSKKLRAGSLINVTVQGNLIYSNYIKSSHVPWFIYTKQLPIQLDVRNDGNVHFFASLSGRVRGLWYNQAFQSGNHLLFPKTNRVLSTQVASPKIPGIYRLDYGYTSTSFPVVQKSSYFIYAPPWSWAVLALILIFAYQIRHRLKSIIVSIRRRLSRSN